MTGARKKASTKRAPLAASAVECDEGHGARARLADEVGLYPAAPPNSIEPLLQIVRDHPEAMAELFFAVGPSGSEGAGEWVASAVAHIVATLDIVGENLSSCREPEGKVLELLWGALARARAVSEILSHARIELRAHRLYEDVVGEQRAKEAIDA